MAELDFIKTDALEITTSILESLETGVKEPLYPGDERRIFGEALAGVVVNVFNSVNDACRQKMLRYARGTVLDAIGQNRDVKRLGVEYAKTTLRFSIKSPLASDIVIPEGIRVTSDMKRYFATDEAVTILSGDKYADVTATAENSGENYNGIIVDTITSIIDISRIPTIDSVTNITESSGGKDGENDESFRERIRESENKLSTAGPAKAYKYYALSANSKVTDAVVMSDEETVVRTLPVYAGHAFLGGDLYDIESLVVSGASSSDYSADYSDGLITITLKDSLASASSVSVSIKRTMHGCVKIVPICANGEIPSEEILQDVLRACSADDVRPLTDRVIVAAPDVETYDIELTYYTDKADESQVIENVEGENGAISRYVYWQGSNLDQDINPDYLKKLILSPNWEADLTGATRVDIIKPVYKPLNKTTIAKFSGNLKVNHIVR